MSSLIKRPVDSVESKTSAYDRLSSGLTAMILLVGFLVTVLFIIWFTSVFKFERNVAPPFVPATIGDDGNDKPEGFEDDELDPGVEDFAEVETPQLAEALEAVSNAVSTIRANSEHVSGDAAVMGRAAVTEVAKVDRPVLAMVFLSTSDGRSFTKSTARILTNRS